MEPTVIDLSEDEQYLRFTLANTNVSIANAIRRIILSEIPCVVFRTAPYEYNLATITKNTSRMNNELIKQRISCIPIHITDVDFPIKEYVVELDVRNDSKEILYATTGDFKIKHIQSNKYLDDDEKETIFPKDKYTGDFIDIVRLRPEISESIPGEHIKMSMKLDIGTAKQDGAFNVVSTCSYAATPDDMGIETAWTTIEQKLKSEGKNEDEILYYEKDWRLLEAKRITKPDSFDFIIETVGQFESLDIVKKAISVMKNKLDHFKEVIQNDGVISKSKTTIPNSFDICLKGEDYTLGKVLEFILYRDYYDNEKQIESGHRLTFCGFQKPHPHIDLSIIRIGFKEETIQEDDVRNLLDIVYQTATKIYNTIENKL